VHIPGQRRGHAYSKALSRFSLSSLLIVLASVYAIAQSSGPVTVPGTTWSVRFDGPARDTERRPVMILDAQGNVFIAAETRSLSDSAEFTTTPDLDIVTRPPKSLVQLVPIVM